MFFVNPTIKNKDKEKTTYEEGCLSVPNYFAEVDRPKYCEVEYLDYSGESKILKADGLLATCIQHEMDHLEGILFIDYLSKLKTMIVKKLLKKKINLIVLLFNEQKNCFYGYTQYFGSNIESLYQNGFDIEIVYTQPPVSSNRGHKLNKSPVHIMSEILKFQLEFSKIRYLEEKI